MRIAFIEPVAHLQAYCGQTDIQMVIPEACSIPAYIDFYRHNSSFKMLDNGAYESPAVSWSDLIRLGKLLAVDEIVVPDVIGNSGATQRLAWEFKQFLELSEDATEFQWMGVAHGKNMGEVISCIQTMAQLDYVTTLALPRIIADTIHPHIRYNIMNTPNLLDMIVEGFPGGVHCLGASKFIKEPILLADTPVRSIDTCMPAKMTLYGQDISTGSYVNRPSNFWKLRYEADLGSLPEINHGKYSEWCIGTNAARGGV